MLDTSGQRELGRARGPLFPPEPDPPVLGLCEAYSRKRGRALPLSRFSSLLFLSSLVPVFCSIVLRCDLSLVFSISPSISMECFSSPFWDCAKRIAAKEVGHSLSPFFLCCFCLPIFV